MTDDPRKRTGSHYFAFGTTTSTPSRNAGSSGKRETAIFFILSLPEHLTSDDLVVDKHSRKLAAEAHPHRHVWTIPYEAKLEAVHRQAGVRPIGPLERRRTRHKVRQLRLRDPLDAYFLRDWFAVDHRIAGNLMHIAWADTLSVDSISIANVPKNRLATVAVNQGSVIRGQLPAPPAQPHRENSGSHDDQSSPVSVQW